jgi:hypothetical protein
MNKTDRSFTVDAFYQNNKHLRANGGRYISSTPSGAAKKAFSQYYRHHKKSGRFSLEIHISETTSGSAKKVFKYKVSKVNDPKEVLRNGEYILYKYTTKVKAI